ncbi:hypothetical protein ACP70R_022591 [Stipagrostis hirtigluma subsp. patula]
MDHPDPKKSKKSVEAGLPDDALVEILSRLPVKALHRSKCVARGWRDLVDDPLHRNKLPQTLRGFLLLRDQIHGQGCQILAISSGKGSSSWSTTRAYWNMWCATQPQSNGWPCPPAILPASARFWSHPCDDDEEEEGEEDSDTDDEMEYGTMVRVYSSETGWWTYSQSDWDEQEGWRLRCNIPYYPDDGAFVQGMLHVLLHEDQIVAVDMQGKTRRAIAAPVKTQESGNRLEGHIFQSQGHLHYILLNSDDEQGPKMSAWVLEDYNTEEWVLKHTVSILDLFEVMRSRWDYDLVTIHPDCNVVFLLKEDGLRIIGGMYCSSLVGVYIGVHDLGVRNHP